MGSSTVILTTHYSSERQRVKVYFSQQDGGGTGHGMPGRWPISRNTTHPSLLTFKLTFKYQMAWGPDKSASSCFLCSVIGTPSNSKDQANKKIKIYI